MTTDHYQKEAVTQKSRPLFCRRTIIVETCAKSQSSTFGTLFFTDVISLMAFGGRKEQLYQNMIRILLIVDKNQRGSFAMI